VKDGAFVHFVVSMERNDDRSFEDRKRILEKIKSLFFNTSHLWTAAFVLFALLVRLLLFYTFYVLGGTLRFY
jgi:hypothetical protein